MAKTLKRISISTNDIVLDSNNELIKEMLELLRAIKTKYRIFLFARVDPILGP